MISVVMTVKKQSFVEIINYDQDSYKRK